MRNGVLNINKPEGITSFDVVDGIKRVAKVKKIGHTGTLDPDASGVLLICLGQATKIVPFLMETTKEYRATLRLGITTDTLDASGTVLERTEGFDFSQEQIREVMDSFVGEIEQIPPMFSALRHQGKRLYELAREGIEVERKAREIQIYHLTMQHYAPPYLTFDVSCSKGTYIRSLCADIGQKLGVGGHMSSLQRLRVGEMTIEQATPFEAITRETISEILATRLHSLDDVLQFLPVVQIAPEAERKVYHGISLLPRDVVKCPENFRKGDLFRGHDMNSHLLGIFEALTDVPCREGGDGGTGGLGDEGTGGLGDGETGGLGDEGTGGLGDGETGGLGDEGTGSTGRRGDRRNCHNRYSWPGNN